MLTTIGIDEADPAIGTGSGKSGAIGIESDGKDAAFVDGNGSESFYAVGEIFLQRLLHLRIALMSGLFDGRGDIGWDLGVGIDFVNVDRALAIEAAAGGDTFGVLGNIDGEDAAFERWKFEKQVGVVPDLARGVAEDAIEFWHAVCTTDDDFIAGGMRDHRADSAGESLRSD